MTWRDDPRIIWQDKDGDHLWHLAGSGGRGDLAIGDGNVIDAAIDAPDSPAEWDELLHRLAAVAGRRITGIEDVPRPIEVGDLVYWDWFQGTYEVRYIDGDQVLIREQGTDQMHIVGLDRLAHVEPDPEPEVRWIQQQAGTTDIEWAEMLSTALDDGRRVEFVTFGEWYQSKVEAAWFRKYGTGDLRYRMEVPFDEAWIWQSNAYKEILAAERELDKRPSRALSEGEFLELIGVKKKKREACES